MVKQEHSPLFRNGFAADEVEEVDQNMAAASSCLSTDLLWSAASAVFRECFGHILLPKENSLGLSCYILNTEFRIGSILQSLDPYDIMFGSEKKTIVKGVRARGSRQRRSFAKSHPSLANFKQLQLTVLSKQPTELFILCYTLQDLLRDKHVKMLLCPRGLGAPQDFFTAFCGLRCTSITFMVHEKTKQKPSSTLQQIFSVILRVLHETCSHNGITLRRMW